MMLDRDWHKADKFVPSSRGRRAQQPQKVAKVNREDEHSEDSSMNVPLRFFASRSFFYPNLKCAHCSHKPQIRAFIVFLPRRSQKAPLPPRTPIPCNDLTIAYLKGSGPGGQKINKTNSAVQIKHLPSGIVIKCQETRSRGQNEKIAMRKLQDRLEHARKEDTDEESRISRRQELLRKRKESRRKKAKRKYRTLEREKKEGEESAEVDINDCNESVEGSVSSVDGGNDATTAKDQDGTTVTNDIKDSSRHS
jgi:hypothetical protein